MNQSMKKLVKFMVEPMFNGCHHFLMSPASLLKGRRLFGAQELKLVHQSLLSQNLFSIGGKMIPAFEDAFASAYDVPYAVASTSGTAAIHTALGAIDLNPGDEIITAPITDMGTIVPILYQNAIPVFADIDETYNMDPEDVERKITSRTRAIIAVHLFGNPCKMDAMAEIAGRHDILLIEDCSQAHMTEYKGKYVGTLGDIGCFSFQQSKHMTTGEGGMTITSNKAFYERMKYFVDKGWARKGWGPRAYHFLAPNYRPTELVGALGLAQIKKVKEVVRKRHDLGEYMTELLTGIPGIKPAPVTPGAGHSYWLYPMGLEDLDIHRFQQEMVKEKVPVSAGYIGIPIYRCSASLAEKKPYGASGCPLTCKMADRTYEYNENLCPRAEEALKHLICIPLDETWSRIKVKRAVDAVIRVMDALGRKRPPVRLVVSNSKKPVDSIPKPVREDGKTRIGIVGCGQMGRWHLDAYKQDSRVDIVAVADKDILRAEQLAIEAGCRAYNSHIEMMQKESLDGVSLCTFPSTHKDVSLDLLEGGVHVLCEKPLAISVAEAHAMIEKAEQKRLWLLPAFKFRFFEEVQKARELIENRSLGDIIGFRMMFGGYLDTTGSWYSQKELSGGGVIMDNGPHAFDVIRYLLGEVKDISAQVQHFQNIPVEDTAKLNLVLQNGGMGTIDLSWSASVPSHSYLEIYGEDGAVFLDLTGISYKFRTWKDWKRIPNRLDGMRAFARQTDHFVNAIRGSGASTLKNEDGLIAQILIERAYESIEMIEKLFVGLQVSGVTG